MRKKMLMGLCAAILLFAVGAFRDGDRIQGSIMIILAFVVMILMIWFKMKDDDD